MRAISACYIGTKKKPEKENFCQAEFKIDLEKWVKGRMSLMLRSDDDRDTWAGRFLPSIQDRCLIQFKNNGIFFVNDGGKGLVVCCSDEHKGNKTVSKFKFKKKYIYFF
jgi:photosystem II stability/assembly factor-like uncharacterized protein